MKPNDLPLYVHKQSNHPVGILKNIPPSVNKRLSSISTNEDIFNECCQPYQDALKASGYDFKLKYNQQDECQSKKQNRGRNITYFNPPYSMNVKTKIGEKFLAAIKNCFPPSHPLAKIINRNTVKISYRCMPNMKQAISRHNHQVQRENETNPVGGCNCRNAANCPMDGHCQTKEVIYQATVVEQNGNTNTYTGLTGNTFKKRYDGHTNSFRNRADSNTTLSTYIWKLKDENTNFNISWKIIDRGKKFNPSTRKCNLCLKEKYNIIFKPSGATLNRRSELFSVCTHRWQKLLSKV